MPNILSCTRVAIDVKNLLNAQTVVFPDETEMVRIRDLDMSKQLSPENFTVT